MTRAELQFLSQAHAVALSAMVAPETRAVPMAAAVALAAYAPQDMPALMPACDRFLSDLRDCRGRLPEVAVAGRFLRTSVTEALAFVPRDLHRVDIHG
jgi:hypothetical protein